MWEKNNGKAPDLNPFANKLDLRIKQRIQSKLRPPSPSLNTKNINYAFGVDLRAQFREAEKEEKPKDELYESPDNVIKVNKARKSNKFTNLIPKKSILRRDHSESSISQDTNFLEPPSALATPLLNRGGPSTCLVNRNSSAFSFRPQSSTFGNPANQLAKQTTVTSAQQDTSKSTLGSKMKAGILKHIKKQMAL